MVEEEGNDVVSGLGSITLQNAQTETETLPEAENVWDTDDSTLLEEQVKEVLARLSVDTTDAEGSD